jgi:hypothetical protein
VDSFFHLRVSYFETSNDEDGRLFPGGVTGLRIVEEIFENCAEMYLNKARLPILGPELIILLGQTKGGGDLEEK